MQQIRNAPSSRSRRELIALAGSSLLASALPGGPGRPPSKPKDDPGRRCNSPNPVNAMRLANGVLALVILPGPLAAQRAVEGNRILSDALPRAALEVAAGLTYAGTQQFDLYGVANAEQHFFVELDGSRVTRLLWIQFEGYHPTNTHTYNYRDEMVEHSGRSWHRRIAASRIPDTDARPDSDGARARAFLRARGWTLGPDVLTERLVWLLDTPPRNELMIIYMEDLADQQLTAADLAEGGRARDRWPAVREAFHGRAVGVFTVRDR